jgi:uncharacterized phage-associated protein
MYKAIDVARYILLSASRYGDLVTDLKLQLLLYYMQASYLVNRDGSLLFSDEIEARKFGPYVNEVHEEYRRFDRRPISEEIEDEAYFKIRPEDRLFLDTFLPEFMDQAAFDLVNCVHNDDPWKEGYSSKNKVISTESMHKYYSEQDQRRFFDDQ